MKTVMVRTLEIGQGIPKICIPIVGENREAIKKELEELLRLQPDLVEWRVDHYQEGPKECLWETLKQIREQLGQIPLLFTFRTLQEGGAQEISYEAYRTLLLKAAETGMADLIDVELFFKEEEAEALIQELHQRKVVVLASNHHFDRTPEADELISRMKKMDACGADILKMAVMPKTERDLEPILEATQSVWKACSKPVVTMSMGKLGVLTRLWGEFTGSCITFASGKKASAPGQIDMETMRTVLQIFHKILHN